MRQRVHVTYRVDATIQNDWFTCDKSSVTIGEHATTVTFTGGVLLTSSCSSLAGYSVVSAQYRDVQVIYRYVEDEPIDKN